MRPSAALALLLVAAAPAVAQEISPPTTLEERAILNGLAIMPEDDTDAFTSRPLFSPSRRPPAPPPPPEPPPEPPPVVDEEPIEDIVEPAGPPRFQLGGTLETPDGIVAFMRDPASGETLSARLGEDVEGWTVTAIEPTGITLELDGAVLDLLLFEPTPAGTYGDVGGDDLGLIDDFNDDPFNDAPAGVRAAGGDGLTIDDGDFGDFGDEGLNADDPYAVAPDGDPAAVGVGDAAGNRDRRLPPPGGGHSPAEHVLPDAVFR